MARGLSIATDQTFTIAGGALPVLPPFPRLGGTLYAAHLFGNLTARASHILTGTAYGAGLDWSGNGRHMSSFGDRGGSIGDYGLPAAVTSEEPMSSFSLADLWTAGSGAFSLVCLANCPAAAKTVSLIRSDSAVSSPYAALTIAPTSADARAQATVTTATTAQIGTLTGELGAVALYAGTYTSAARNVFSRVGVASTKTATETTALGSITGSQHFEFADEAGSGTGTGTTTVYAAAFYSKALSQMEFETIHDRLKAFYAAIGSGLTI